MTASNFQNNSLTQITNELAALIPSEFYRLRSSYNSLSVHEVFIEILLNRNYSFKENWTPDQYDELKASLVLQLQESSLDKEFSAEQITLEAFHLGSLVATLVHTNIPVPEVAKVLGKYQVNS